MALAALNFDFSLYKVEAPKEYQLLGSSLSEDRRRQAEGGSQHIAARKLGAIFRAKLPKVPHLLQAFGCRVSEIAAASKKMKSTTEHSTEGHENHVFSKNVGIDGTSLWAAATSGPEALCVQLLACILARVWSAPQAISIWAEILDARKAELHQEGMDIADIAALNATVTREQLAELDASTRSWLQTADAFKSTELIQLRLIIGNINTPVNHNPDTYQSVMEAWTESMNVTDRLVAGVAQTVYNGAALLGLSAWHLYPDMSVYSRGPASEPPEKDIRQNDPLINPGGILTIGLQPSDDFNYGVRWSLPLAKLRYYGAPTKVTRTLDSNPSRVSVTELMLAVLGALASTWPDTRDKLTSVCKFYRFLASRIKGHHSLVDAGYKALGKAAEEFLSATPDRQRILMRIMAYGSRNGGEFLRGETGSTPTFERQTSGITKATVLLEHITTLETKQQILAEIFLNRAQKLNSQQWMVVTRTDATFLALAYCPNTIPYQHSTGSGESPLYDFRQWISNSSGGLLWHASNAVLVETEPWKWAKSVPQSRSSVAWREVPSAQSKLFFTPLVSGDAHSVSTFSQHFYPEAKRTGNALKSLQFEHYFGDPRTGAIYIEIGAPKPAECGPMLEYEFEMDRILEFMRRGFVDVERVMEQHDESVIRLLGVLDHVYQDFEHSDVGVSLDVIRTPLSSKSCFSKFLLRHELEILDLAVAFSVIAYFETGDQDLDPKLLSNVMAIVVGNSIYANSALSSDPHESPNRCRLSRTFGNIGKSGVSLLIAPPSPRVKENDTGEWYIIGHEPWDGTTANQFNKTSLHLSLTEYRVPFTANHQGQRDMQAFFQEAIVSVYDGSVWVGDVDIVKALSSKTSKLTRVSSKCDSGHMDGESQTWTTRRQLQKLNKEKNAGTKQIVCADSWQEILDKPKNPVILRCHGNWVGRLAVASISTQLGYRTILLPKNVCPAGCFQDLDFMCNGLAEEGDVIIF